MLGMLRDGMLYEKICLELTKPASVWANFVNSIILTLFPDGLGESIMDA